ncbi:MAG: ABC transporter permease, partial [Clostridia bacterium]|nr:ABC transporter permease [Clostridia bacterium]
MKRHRPIVLGLITFQVYVFLIGPLVIIMAASFGEQSALVFPGQGFTFTWYLKVFEMSSFIRSAVLSLEIAFGATFL